MRHFFPIGEVNGSHGVYRPGGSALNAGQCGGLRAAQYIAKRYRDEPPSADDFAPCVAEQVEHRCRQIAQLLHRGGSAEALAAYRHALQLRMSAFGAQIRDGEKLQHALREAGAQFAAWQDYGVTDPRDLPYAVKNLDGIIMQLACLTAMVEYHQQGGTSRGSYLVMDRGGVLPCTELEDDFRFKLGEDCLREKICEVFFHPNGEATCRWVDRRPIPQEGDWFENVWADYREDRVIV